MSSRGSHQINAHEDGEDTLEKRTINRNLLTTIYYTANKNWSFSALLPVVEKYHSHVNNPQGAIQNESWSFSRLGDIKLVSTYRLDAKDEPYNLGFRAGLKLPTGSYQVANAAGTIAERALQPGTGSSDLIFGVFYSSVGFTHDASWFLETSAQSSMMTSKEFRPGNQYQLSTGYKQPFTKDLSVTLQINATSKDADSGINAEPLLSGSKSVYITPGISYSVTKDWLTYLDGQFPVYRYVNGIQLSADASLIAGFTFRY